MADSLRPSKNKRVDKIADLIVRKSDLPVSTPLQTVQVWNDDQFEEYITSHKFDKNKKPPVYDAILFQADQEIGSRSNILAITGRAKSRKSAVASAILSAMLSPSRESILGFTANIGNDDKIVHIDTEQSLADYWKGLDRTLRRAGTGAREGILNSIYARDAEIEFLVEITDYLFRKHKPRVAFIDGVSDYLFDINDHKGVSILGRRIMKWSTDHDCLVIVIIHTTKTTGFMTGALGTWFEKKAETVIKCDKPDDQQEITNVTCQYAREKPFHPFTIMFDDPTDQYVVVDESKIVQPQGPKSEKAPTSFGDDIHEVILRKIFLVSTSVSVDQIIKAISTHAKDVAHVRFGDQIAKRWLNYYRDKTWLLCDPENNWSRVIKQDNKPGTDNTRPATATDDLPF